MAAAAKRRKYRKISEPVVAVQLDLDTDGLTYRKWGAVQLAKRGDWLVENDGEVYTVERKVFAKTYKRHSRGLYKKITPVWAEVAKSAGFVATKEGASHYQRGDYIVFNNRNGRDGYCMTAKKFKASYRPYSLRRPDEVP